MNASRKRPEPNQAENTESTVSQDGRVVSWEVEFEPGDPPLRNRIRRRNRRHSIARVKPRKLH
jgi:hypothetical protein